MPRAPGTCRDSGTARHRPGHGNGIGPEGRKQSHRRRLARGRVTNLNFAAVPCQLGGGRTKFLLAQRAGQPLRRLPLPGLHVGQHAGPGLRFPQPKGRPHQGLPQDGRQVRVQLQSGLQGFLKFLLRRAGQLQKPVFRRLRLRRLYRRTPGDHLRLLRTRLPHRRPRPELPAKQLLQCLSGSGQRQDDFRDRARAARTLRRGPEPLHPLGVRRLPAHRVFQKRLPGTLSCATSRSPRSSTSSPTTWTTRNTSM